MNGYLFYSEKCDFCLNLRNVMNNQGILGMFRVQSVDGMRGEEIARLGLTAVPTIVIVATNGAKGIYEKEDAFKYIEGLIANKRKNAMMQSEKEHRLIQANNIKRNAKDGLYEYQKHESEGFSDLYAYWSKDLEKDLDVSQPKSFLPHGKDAEYAILTIPESKADVLKNKLTKDDQDKMMTKMDFFRKEQDTQLKMFMEKEQIEKVIKVEMGEKN